MYAATARPEIDRSLPKLRGQVRTPQCTVAARRTVKQSNCNSLTTLDRIVYREHMCLQSAPEGPALMHMQPIARFGRLLTDDRMSFSPGLRCHCDPRHHDQSDNSVKSEVALRCWHHHHWILTIGDVQSAPVRASYLHLSICCISL